MLLLFPFSATYKVLACLVFKLIPSEITICAFIVCPLTLLTCTSCHDFTDEPISFYAATKKSNEMMAYSYSHLYNVPCTGLRFFTVYGPWGRPDMSLFGFVQKIYKDKPIYLFNKGNHYRDFTYIDDVVEILISLSKIKFKKNYDVLNICSSRSESLIKFTKLIERYYAKKAIIKNKKRLNLEVLKTHGDNSKILKLINKKRFIKIEQGLEKTVKWFKSYNKV